MRPAPAAAPNGARPREPASRSRQAPSCVEHRAERGRPRAAPPRRSPRRRSRRRSARGRTRRRSPASSTTPRIRAIGMSPSPGTSRCDDATVPTLKSLTCTSRMRSMPSRIVALERALGPARVDLHAHARRRAGARGRSRPSGCARTRRRRAASSCARSRTGCRALAPAPARARAPSSRRVGGLLPRQRRERAGGEHQALGADRGRGVERVHEPVLLLRPARRVGEVERAEADEVRDAQPARRPRPDTSRVPASQPKRSSFATDTPTVPMSCRSQNARSSVEREVEGRDRAHADAGVHRDLSRA